VLTLHIVLGFEAGLSLAGLTGRSLFIPKIDPSCPSAAHFYEDCVKLIRILTVEILISLINNVERIFVVLGL
jgi:hypothetical protein